MSETLDCSNLTEREGAVYEQGYRNGESSAYNDWEVALGDTRIPDDVISRGPNAVAAWLDAELQRNQ